MLLVAVWGAAATVARPTTPLRPGPNTTTTAAITTATITTATATATVTTTVVTTTRPPATARAAASLERVPRLGWFHVHGTAVQVVRTREHLQRARKGELVRMR